MFKRVLDFLFAPTVATATKGLSRMLDQLQRAEEAAKRRASVSRELRDLLRNKALEEDCEANLHDAEAKRARRLAGQIDAFLLPN